MDETADRPVTLAGIVRGHAQRQPDRTAMRWDGGSMTYAELDVRSSRVAQALRAYGVDAGDRVARVDKNSPEQFELFFGAAKLGAI
ncbi:MAG: AMP-binding protein, partial [Ilumatobacteraceae bacterium]